MKKGFLLIFAGFFFIGSAAVAQSKTEDAFKNIEFEAETVDFGTTKLNEPATVVFNFKNTGDRPLIIKSAQPSCGCTTPEWSKEPIIPGKEGQIKATYNAASLGKTSKIVFVNFQGIAQTKELHLKGTVVK